MAWYNDLYDIASKTYDYAVGYGQDIYEYASSAYDYVEGYAETAYENVSGFLGFDDTPYSTSYAAGDYIPNVKGEFTYYDAGAIANAQQNVLSQTLTGTAAYADYAPAAASWLDSAWGSVKRGVNTAQDWYGGFKESTAGKFVDEVVGYGAGKGAPQFNVPPVSPVRAPGVASAGRFQSSAVDLTAGFADPRISNAMQKALSSDVPQIQLVLQSIQPTRRAASANISLTSASVSAPKIRKVKSSLSAKSST